MFRKVGNTDMVVSNLREADCYNYKTEDISYVITVIATVTVALWGWKYH